MLYSTVKAAVQHVTSPLSSRSGGTRFRAMWPNNSCFARCLGLLHGVRNFVEAKHEKWSAASYCSWRNPSDDRSETTNISLHSKYSSDPAGTKGLPNPTISSEHTGGEEVAVENNRKQCLRWIEDHRCESAEAYIDEQPSP